MLLLIPHILRKQTRQNFAHGTIAVRSGMGDIIAKMELQPIEIYDEFKLRWERRCVMVDPQ